jgi:hypothetical protein
MTSSMVACLYLNHFLWNDRFLSCTKMADHHMKLYQIYEIQRLHGSENLGCGTEAVFLQNMANHLLDNPSSTYKSHHFINVLKCQLFNVSSIVSVYRVLTIAAHFSTTVQYCNTVPYFLLLSYSFPNSKCQ